MISAVLVRVFLRGYSSEILYIDDIDQQVDLVQDQSLRNLLDSYFLNSRLAIQDTAINPVSERSVSHSVFNFVDVTADRRQVTRFNSTAAFRGTISNERSHKSLVVRHS